MTREEVVAILNSQNYNQLDLANIMLHNIAIRNQKKEPILYEPEEREIIELLYSIGAEDYFIEQREAATAFLFHKKSLDVFLSDIEAINDYLSLEQSILSGAEISIKLLKIIESNTKPEIDPKELKEYVAEFTDINDIVKNEAASLLVQAPLTIGGFKAKVIELKVILKEYLKEIDSFKEMIPPQEQRAKKASKEILEKALIMNKKYQIPIPRELVSYSKTKAIEPEKRISKLIYP
jgi:hypothetical protein